MTNIRLRAAFAALALGATASAEPIVGAIDRTFGTGPDQLYVVIDWNDGPDDSLTWRLDYTDGGYAGVHAVLLDLETLDSALDYLFQDFTWGIQVDGFDYDDGALTHSINTSTSPAPRDWISFWEGDASGSTWTAASVGVADLAPSPGRAYGFNVEADWNEPSSAPNAIPEPTLVWLLAVGIGWLTWLRRVSR